MSILRYENIEWSLPYLFGFDFKLIKIVNILKDLNCSFKFNAFGATKSKWSGGRESVVSTDNKIFIMNLLSQLVDIGVTPSLTFSNHHVAKEDLNDSFCNYMLDLSQDLGCNLILSSDLLFEYVKNKYPSSKCTASVIKPIFKFQTPDIIKDYNFEEELDFYNRLTKNYDKVVVRPEFAKFYLPKFYNRINNLGKIEVLVNQSCVPNCPIATEHYTYFEKLETQRLEKAKYRFECYHNQRKSSYADKLNDNLHFDTKEVDELVNIGIKNLKLQGRAGSQGDTMPFLAFYNYVLKPGVQNFSFQVLLEKEDKDIERYYKADILK